MAWFDRSGKRLGELGEPGAYLTMRLAPDERHVAVSFGSGSPPNTDVWVMDVARGSGSRLTFNLGLDGRPVWSPDSRSIAFLSIGADSTLRRKAVSGTGDDEVLAKGPTTFQALTPTDWSADGQFLAYEMPAPGGSDLWILPLGGDRKPFPIVQGPTPDTSGAFSPDGRWFAYASVESGEAQVYVKPFPPGPGGFQLSKNGGLQPQWRRDGKELFFLALDGVLMVVPIGEGGRFDGAATPLFQTGSNTVGLRSQYGATKDGQRFLVLVPQSDRSLTAAPLTVVVNWLASVQK